MTTDPTGTRRPTRLPGDPPVGDERFGALGGLVDDIYFWERNRAREQDAVARRRLSAPDALRAPGHARPTARLRALRDRITTLGWLDRRAGGAARPPHA